MKKGEQASTLIPRGVFEGLADELADLLFQGSEIGDALFAFAGFLESEGFGGGLSLQEAGPAEVGAVELGGGGFAAAVGFAASAAGGGDAAWEQREGDAEGDSFCCGSAFFCLHES